jgi:hypothetical protein
MDDDDSADALDDINNASERPTIDDEFRASGGKPPLRSIGPGTPVNGPPIKRLADERWDDHFDNPHVGRDTLRRAKGGDEAAKLEFYRAWHKTLDIAGDPKYGGPPFEEKLSAAEVGFWVAFRGFNLSRNNGFYAYAIKFIGRDLRLHHQLALPRPEA